MIPEHLDRPRKVMGELLPKESAMSLRLDPTDPADMIHEDRLDEIASIFARGILRLHGRIAAPAG